LKRAILKGATGISLAIIDELVSLCVRVTTVCRQELERINSISSHPFVDIEVGDLNNLNLQFYRVKERYDVFFHLGSGVARPLKECIYTVRDAIDPTLPIGIGK